MLVLLGEGSFGCRRGGSKLRVVFGVLEHLLLSAAINNEGERKEAREGSGQTTRNEKEEGINAYKASMSKG